MHPFALLFLQFPGSLASLFSVNSVDVVGYSAELQHEQVLNSNTGLVLMFNSQ